MVTVEDVGGQSMETGMNTFAPTKNTNMTQVHAWGFQAPKAAFPR